MKPLVIYHGNCADGFGSAWVARRFFGGTENAEFHPGVYGKAPPDVTGREVFILDFSFPRAVLEVMSKQAQWITIIDHHKTAAEDLKNITNELNNVSCEFDMGHSGAMLTWLWFYGPNVPAPRLIAHIEDRDLWKFELQYTREIQAAVFSYPYDFEVWDGLAAVCEQNALQLVREGEAIERKHFKDIAELIALCQTGALIGGHDVPVANLPYTMASDAANIMAEGQPFAACYYIDKWGDAVFSLRSRPDGIDVSAIAQRFGGGGHRNASGFRIAATRLSELGVL